MKRFIALVAAVAACGDSDVTRTYGEAVAGWARGWCSYAERCQPALFALEYGNQTDCIETVTRENCEHVACNTTLPANREDAAEACEADLRELSCTATNAPESCHETFKD